MKIDVNFAQNDMAIRPAFDTAIQTPGGDGVVFVPEVSAEGILRWTNNGGFPNPEPVSIKGKDGIDGKAGADGKDGVDGTDGYTPVKGTDYWTAADKAEIVADVISALPVYNGEVV